MINKVIHGYDPDTGSLFKWDKDFSYLGKTDAPPEDAEVLVSHPLAHIECEMVSAYFLGGKRDPIGIYWSDGTEYVYTIMTVKDGSFVMLQMLPVQESNIRAFEGNAIYLTGPICSNPAKVGDFCRKVPVKYVCTMGTDSAAFGLTILKSPNPRPRRAELTQVNNAEMDSESIAFDPTFPDDAMGNMALRVSKGIAVVNDIRIAPGISPFYGKIVTNKIIGDPVFMIDCPMVDKYFPSECLSIKMYAATNVPVEVENTGAFRKDTGYIAGKVKILIATSYHAGFQQFMQMYNIHSGRHWVALLDPKKMKPTGPVIVFRNNKAYRMSPDAFKVKYHDIA